MYITVLAAAAAAAVYSKETANEWHTHTEAVTL